MSGKDVRTGPDAAQPKSAPGRVSAGDALYAALDLGTNSCRMLIAAPQGEQFRIVDAFSKPVRLGTDIQRYGKLSSASINRAVQALQICSAKLKQYNVRQGRFVATEACRRARNGQSFLDQVKARTGLGLEVIRPQEEARLAVVSCAPLVQQTAQQVLVVDIGGGSTELIWIDLSDVETGMQASAMLGLRPRGNPENSRPTPEGARIVDWISVPLGVATLNEKFLDVEEDGARYALMSCHFEEHMDAFLPYQEQASGNLQNFQMIGTSGTVTTVAAAHLNLRRYDRARVDGLAMTAGQVDAVVRKFLELGPNGRINHPGIGRDRSKLIMSGAAILQSLLRVWPTDHMYVADRGLREGMLYSMMSEAGALNG